jgi:DNA-binding NtrC family response regulator
MGSYRVLIVDDEEMVRNLVFSLLSQKGYTCEMAKGGIEALRKIKNDSFDAVVSDIVMPHMDGITLTKELLRLHSNLPVMLMTGHSHGSAESAIAAGAREFITKPFSIQEFIIRFYEMMRDHRGEEALSAPKF